MSSWLTDQADWIWRERIGPTLLILDDPGIRPAVRRHVRVDDRSIDWQAICELCPALSDLALIEAARNLFDPSSENGIGCLSPALTDDRQLRVYLAWGIAKGWVNRSAAFATIRTRAPLRARSLTIRRSG